MSKREGGVKKKECSTKFRFWKIPDHFRSLVSQRWIVMFISDGFCPLHFKRKDISALCFETAPFESTEPTCGWFGDPWSMETCTEKSANSFPRRSWENSSGIHIRVNTLVDAWSDGQIQRDPCPVFKMLKHEPFWQKQCCCWGDIGLCWQLDLLIEGYKHRTSLNPLGLDWWAPPRCEGSKKVRKKWRYEGPRWKWRSIKPTNIIIFIITRTRRVESYKWILKGVTLMWSWDTICSLSSIDAHWAQSKRCNGQSPHPSTCWRSWGCWVCGFCWYAMSYSEHEVDSDGCKKRRTDVRSLFFNPFRSRTEIFTAIHFFLPLFVAFSDHGCHCYHLRFCTWKMWNRNE